MGPLHLPTFNPSTEFTGSNFRVGLNWRIGGRRVAALPRRLALPERAALGIGKAFTDHSTIAQSSW